MDKTHYKELIEKYFEETDHGCRDKRTVRLDKE